MPLLLYAFLPLSSLYLVGIGPRPLRIFASRCPFVASYIYLFGDSMYCMPYLFIYISYALLYLLVFVCALGFYLSCFLYPSFFIPAVLFVPSSYLLYLCPLCILVAWLSVWVSVRLSACLGLCVSLFISVSDVSISCGGGVSLSGSRFAPSFRVL